MEEIWKEIIGTNGSYSVSNKGRIRTNEYYVKNRYGERVVSGRIKKLNNHNQGYLIVSFFRFGKTKLVHRIVATHFIPNPNNLEFVNHKNGDKKDNQVENLEWCTRQQNEDHAFSTGLKNSSESANTMSKLNESQVLEIRANNGVLSKKELSDKYGVHIATINRVLNRSIWNHI
jgi:hypothetical protein